MKHLPTPLQCRIKGKGSPLYWDIRWEVVDPWLRRFRGRGYLTRLSKLLRISLTALRARRKELGLDVLPVGRPPTIRLTQKEVTIMTKVDAGALATVVAAELGVEPSTVRNALARAKDKLIQSFDLGCFACGGSGLVPCRGGCSGPKAPHNHVCLSCGGKSTYWASAGMGPR